MDHYDLDHVALAAADTSRRAALPHRRARRHRHLRRRRASASGPMQVWVGDDTGDGMSIELLEPWDDRAATTSSPASSRATAPARITSRSRCPISPPRSSALRGAGFRPVNIDLSRPGVEGSVPAPARGARHGRAARRDRRGRSAHAPSCSPTCASTARTCTRAGGSTPNRARGRRRSCAASCCAHRAFRRRSASSAGCCRATCHRPTVATDRAPTARAGPRGVDGSIAPRTCSTGRARPACDRLEVESASTRPGRTARDSLRTRSTLTARDS